MWNLMDRNKQTNKTETDVDTENRQTAIGGVPWEGG